jgi:ABC-2 type transport system permease protein
MATNTPAKNKQKELASVRLALIGAILICANVLASYFHKGIDLTHEKRFTLTDATRKMLRNMPEVAVVDVYLKGKFPAGLQRMQEAVRERLRSFKDIAPTKIVFRFVDPYEGKNDKEKKAVAHDLGNKGIRTLELKTEAEDEYSMKFFVPYALVQYNGREMPIYLLDAPPDRSTAEQLNYSETMLEYKFANAINQLSKPTRPSVAYIVGNGEPLNVKTVDMLTTLPGIYNLDTVDLAHSVHISLAYDAAIINEPSTGFTGPEKLKIDQFIMHGGHVLWIVNQLTASLDSLAIHPPQQIAMEQSLQLDDILFKYGVRVNNDLLEDMQCMPLPRTMNDGKPELHPWIYFPRLNPTGEHPIVKNMDVIYGGFTNTIDTMRSPDIKKTVLLQSSKYSRFSRSPVRISLSMMNYPLKNEMFTKPNLPVAVLLEGKFHSLYQNRLAPEFLRYLADTVKEPFKPMCDSPTSMIVTSVGEIFSNGYSTKDGILGIGYYRFTGEYFSNKSFLLNCMEYLTDHSGILEARSKDAKLRLLDAGRTKPEKTQWQLVNVGLPIGIVLVFASAYLFFRKRRYESKPSSPKSISTNA